jgi:hypothetical protein
MSCRSGEQPSVHLRTPSRTTPASCSAIRPRRRTPCPRPEARETCRAETGTGNDFEMRVMPRDHVRPFGENRRAQLDLVTEVDSDGPGGCHRGEHRHRHDQQGARRALQHPGGPGKNGHRQTGDHDIERHIAQGIRESERHHLDPVWNQPARDRLRQDHGQQQAPEESFNRRHDASPAFHGVAACVWDPVPRSRFHGTLRQMLVSSFSSRLNSFSRIGLPLSAAAFDQNRRPRR